MNNQSEKIRGFLFFILVLLTIGCSAGFEPKVDELKATALEIDEPLEEESQELFVITYDGNGDSTDYLSTSLPSLAGTKIPIIDVSLEKKAHHFIGWTAEDNEENYRYQVGESYLITKDVTLYAQWRVEVSISGLGYSTKSDHISLESSTDTATFFPASFDHDEDPSTPVLTLTVGTITTEEDQTRVESITIDAGWEEIPEGFLKRAYELREIIMPEGLLLIGNDAFKQTQLTEVQIPSTVTVIEEGAFMKIEALETINAFPEGLTLIGKNAFYETSLKAVSFPSSLRHIGANAFKRADFTEAIFPEGLMTIGREAFKSTRITELILPGSLQFREKDIGQFEYVNTLEKATLEEGISILPKRMFYRNHGLTELILPSTLNFMGAESLKSCPLEIIRIRAITPPQMGTIDDEGKDGYNPFMSTRLDQITLYVPAESVEAYQQAPYWQEMTVIAE